MSRQAIKCSHYKEIYFPTCPSHSLLNSGNDAWLGHVTDKEGKMTVAIKLHHFVTECMLFHLQDEISRKINKSRVAMENRNHTNAAWK
jgi:hypothetical protein